MEPRLIAAACLSGVSTLGAVIGLAVHWRRARADRRRRRGIKSYNMARPRAPAE